MRGESGGCAFMEFGWHCWRSWLDPCSISHCHADRDERRLGRVKAETHSEMSLDDVVYVGCAVLVELEMMTSDLQSL